MKHDDVVYALPLGQPLVEALHEQIAWIRNFESVEQNVHRKRVVDENRAYPALLPYAAQGVGQCRSAHARDAVALPRPGRPHIGVDEQGSRSRSSVALGQRGCKVQSVIAWLGAGQMYDRGPLARYRVRAREPQRLAQPVDSVDRIV